MSELKTIVVKKSTILEATCATDLFVELMELAKEQGFTKEEIKFHLSVKDNSAFDSVSALLMEHMSVLTFVD